MKSQPHSVFGQGLNFISDTFDAITQPLQDFTKFSMSLSIRLFILEIPRCPIWNSLRILFLSDMGITTCLLHISILLRIKYMSVFCWFLFFSLSYLLWICCLMLFSGFCQGLLEVAAQCFIGYFWSPLLPVRKQSLYLPCILKSAWLNFAYRRNSILKL